MIGSGNRLAHSAALAVAELPGEAYNPLFLHGPPGLGKTHLLGAIVDYLRRRRPELTVHYTTAERFTTEFVGALRKDGPERFKQRYRKLDALLIDDVQELEGKEHTQEEFVQTFNSLHAAGKQIVLSSDRPPEALARLAERLRDRFGWGLCVELGSPDFRTRTALLWRMAVEGPWSSTTPRPLNEIASQAVGNVRRLQGAMTRVAAVSSMLSQPVTPALARQALDQSPAGGPPAQMPPAQPTPPASSAIQEAVCSVLGVSRQDLLSPRRTARVSRARHWRCTSPVISPPFRSRRSRVSSTAITPPSCTPFAPSRAASIPTRRPRPFCTASASFSPHQLTATTPEPGSLHQPLDSPHQPSADSSRTIPR